MFVDESLPSIKSKLRLIEFRKCVCVSEFINQNIVNPKVLKNQKNSRLPEEKLQQVEIGETASHFRKCLFPFKKPLLIKCYTLEIVFSQFPIWRRTLAVQRIPSRICCAPLFSFHPHRTVAHRQNIRPSWLVAVYSLESEIQCSQFDLPTLLAKQT
jgi:hypothetical protein